jgi:hypothetical protein
MPLVRHRLDCCICLVPPDRQYIHQLQTLAEELLQAKKRHKLLPCGSFESILVESFDHPRLYANHQGGYRVGCPACSQNIAKAFSRAVENWRKGAERTMECDSCFLVFPLEEAKGRPPFAFSSSSIILHDVQEAFLGDFWKERCDALLVEYCIIFRRVG